MSSPPGRCSRAVARSEFLRELLSLAQLNHLQLRNQRDEWLQAMLVGRLQGIEIGRLVAASDDEREQAVLDEHMRRDRTGDAAVAVLERMDLGEAVV